MSESHDLPAESSAGPRSRWGCFLVCLLAACGLLGGTLFYLAARGDRALREAEAEADTQDPGWRLADLEEKRVRPPDKDNSAIQVQAAKRLIPANWGGAPGYAELFQDLPPEAQLNAQQVSALKAELGKAGKGVEEARKLADMPDGYFVVNWTPDVISTSLTGIQDVRQVVSVLRDDAFLRAQEKDADGAVRSLQAAVNGGRSIGDVPTAIGQLVRIACVAVGTFNLERVLAQGEPTPAVLEKMQHLLEEEDQHTTLLVMARGERASSDQCVTWLESGKASRASVAGLAGGPGDPGMVVLMNVPGELRREHAALLRYMNEFVETAKLPDPQRKQRYDELEVLARQQPPLVRLLAPAMAKLAGAAQRQHAYLRCAIVMLAAERYRQEHKRWPESVKVLVDDRKLEKAPVDPYDGDPLRLRRVDDGLVIYAVGPDGVDDSGNLDRKTAGMTKGTDLGFRLWDADKRRRPPLPPKPVESPADAPPGGPLAGRAEGGPPGQAP